MLLVHTCFHHQEALHLPTSNRLLAKETATEYHHEVTAAAANALNGLVSPELAKAMLPKSATNSDKARSLRLHELNAQANLPGVPADRKSELTVVSSWT